MTQVQMANEWLTRNQRKMVSCPYQPGQLTISKNACSKRYILGKQENPADLLKGDLFHYTFKRGLSLCRDCPIGKKLALAHPERNDAPIPQIAYRRGSRSFRQAGRAIFP
jgi:hypothetical protein